MESTERTFSLEELASLTCLPPRTIRYYIQEGLVERPSGSRKGAFYQGRHLERLLAIRRWRDAGFSLDHIRRLISQHDAPSSGAAVGRAPGVIEVVTRLLVAEGVEVLIEPGASGLTPEQAREFLAGVARLYEQTTLKGEE